MRTFSWVVAAIALAACVSPAAPQTRATVLVFGLESDGPLSPDALPSSVDVIERRLGAAGLGSASVLPQGADKIEVRIPGVIEIEPVVDLIGPSGIVSFHMVDESAKSADYGVATSRDGRIALPDDGAQGAPLVLYVDPVVRGQDLIGASQAMDSGNRPAIAFQLSSSASERFGRATSQNIGRRFAIVVDSRILSAPRIMGAIESGSGMITGSFTREEAERLAIVLRAGALPVRLKLLKTEAAAQ